MSETVGQWFANLFQHVISFFKTEVQPIEQKIAKFADTVTNDLKNVTSSDAFKTVLNGLEAAAEAIDPALTPMIQGLNLAIPKIVNTVAGVDTAINAEVSKTLEQQGADALQKIAGVKPQDISIYSGLVGTINTAIQNFITTNNGIVATPAQLLTAAQAVHAAS